MLRHVYAHRAAPCAHSPCVLGAGPGGEDEEGERAPGGTVGGGGVPGGARPAGAGAGVGARARAARQPGEDPRHGGADGAGEPAAGARLRSSRPAPARHWRTSACCAASNGVTALPRGQGAEVASLPGSLLLHCLVLLRCMDRSTYRICSEQTVGGDYAWWSAKAKGVSARCVCNEPCCAVQQHLLPCLAAHMQCPWAQEGLMPPGVSFRTPANCNTDLAPPSRVQGPARRWRARSPSSRRS
jgi:hypothetical protein